MKPQQTTSTPRRHLVSSTALVATIMAFALTALPTVALAQDGGQPEGASAPATGGIGVVDMDRIVSDSAMGKRLTAEGAEIARTRKEEVDALATQGQEAVEAAKTLAVGSEQRRELEAQIRQIQFRFQFLQQYAQNELSEFRKSANIALDSAMKQAVAEVARDRGLLLVFRKSSPLPPNLVQANDATVNQLLQGQGTLYVSPGVDITSEVIQKMNAAPEPAMPTSPQPTGENSGDGSNGSGGGSSGN